MKIKSYISDPEWNNSFLGRFFWIYRGGGYLEWTENGLVYSDKKREIKIDKGNILEITLGRYHRTAKPITLNYIDIKYKGSDSQARHLYLTPTIPNRNPWLTSVWGTNKYVKKYLEEMTEWNDS